MARLSRQTRRKFRTQRRLKRPVDNGRMRLSVFRSNKFIYAQIIDPRKGLTLAEANTMKLKDGDKKEQARAAGKLLAERALAAGIKDVIFDRAAYRYHGRVKALAEGAREGGLNF
ncbi:MAG TPA: 50S ribosomal protein L18 [Trueperaceae bacterium]|nr:50S ribosomal protein L18 [Trueperaceae bacterium]